MQQLQTLNPDSSPNLRVSKPLFQGTRVGGGRRLPDLLPSPAPEVQSQKMKLPAGREGPVLFLTLSQCSSLQTSRRHPEASHPLHPPPSQSLEVTLEDAGGPSSFTAAKLTTRGTASLGAGARSTPRLVIFLWTPWEREPRCAVQKRRAKPRLLLLPMATLSSDSTAQGFSGRLCSRIFMALPPGRDCKLLRDGDSVFLLPSSAWHRVSAHCARMLSCFSCV